ncbi:MAG: histidinol dehydrogenase [Chloroflexi bacterium]|nr:histidinol dehydrogenase [Chloroflexota bacterium]MCY4248622.1 histidinol dehydrogenase [Chloroflexota bacterium]
MSHPAWRIIRDIDLARESLLKRRSLRDIELPESVLARTAALFDEPVAPDEAVRRIIASVRQDGDKALRQWNRRLDNSDNPQLQAAPKQLRSALDAISSDLRASMQTAARRIRDFHQRQPLQSWIDSGEHGALGQLIRPVDSVGVYVPGGSAPLPSSLLMSVIPAQVAGVPDIAVCTPPGSGGDIHPVILAAAAVAGVERVYRVGGAQAIAAMAYGTQTIPRAATIVGAGNLFVTLAKQQVYGDVGIDGLLGPTETVVIADEHADPQLAAADLLAQAEHDLLASAILLTPSEKLARAVGAEIARQLESLSRREIILGALGNASGCVITADLQQAFQLANDYAAEHLCLLVDDAWSWLGHVRNAGGVFLGEHSCEVLGDYVAGPSHVMPTGGTARFASPLNALSFVKITSLIALDKSAARELSGTAQALAQAESLDAHAAAARLRAKGDSP